MSENVRIHVNASIDELIWAIEQRLISVMRADPAIQQHLRREEARTLYGARALRQPHSHHAESRRAKRRQRKTKRGR